MNIPGRKWHWPAVSFLISMAIMLVPALINGFPFVYSDTGTYLRSAFEGYIPFDRPYWYGPFLYIASMGGISLWGVVLVQTALITLYLQRMMRWMLGAGHTPGLLPVVSAVLMLGSSLSWYATQLIPDIFTGIGLLAISLLLARVEGVAWRMFDGAVIVAACWMHLSNLVILPLTGVMLLFIDRDLRARGSRERLTALGCTTLLAWGGLALAHHAVDGKAYISRSSHVFFMGRMLDTGMLRPYLEEHCPTEHYRICDYIDSLPPNSEAFLWRSDSPVAKQGGWAATNQEYGRIVRGSFIEPRYLWWHVHGSVVSTFHQLCAWEICNGLRSGWYRTPDGPPYQMIAQHLPDELPAYLGAAQNGGRGELDMRLPDISYRLVLGLSIVAAAWFVLGNGDQRSRVMIMFALGAVIIGAWVCASLSVVDTRYLGRDSWLLPFAVMLAFIREIGWKRGGRADG